MKQSKESLIAELAKSQQFNEHWSKEDERRRKEFAKAFGWFKRNPYGGDPEYSVPTWEQIWVEVGKLLNVRDFRDYEGNISELECKLEDLEKRIAPEKP